MKSTEADSPVWLITGCSSGFGAEIARQVLERGDRAIVTARRIETVQDLVETHPGRAIAVPLDVTRAEQVANALAVADGTFGRIDILVNNAGVSYLTSIEEGDDARIRNLFEANYFGPLALIKGVLPQMRGRRSGRIINVSSIGGIAAFAASGYYASTKFALEALSEALAQEVTPLGIKVSLIEPGPFRTGMAERAEHAESRNPDYEATVHARRAQFRATAEDFPGDPARGAAAIISLADMDEPPLRLILGAPALAVARRRFSEMLAHLDTWEPVTLGADFPEPSEGDWSSVVAGGAR